MFFDVLLIHLSKTSGAISSSLSNFVKRVSFGDVPSVPKGIGIKIVNIHNPNSIIFFINIMEIFFYPSVPGLFVALGNIVQTILFNTNISIKWFFHHVHGHIDSRLFFNYLNFFIVTSHIFESSVDTMFILDRMWFIFISRKWHISCIYSN